jgi:DNA-directed RNA polymerase specialized sigma24 family protein
MQLPEPGSDEFGIVRTAAKRLYHKYRGILQVSQAAIDASDIEQGIWKKWLSCPKPIRKPAGFAYQFGRYFVIDQLRKANSHLCPIEELGKEICDPRLSEEEVESEPDSVAEDILYWANRCTRTERLFFLLKTLPRYCENRAYLMASADALAQANKRSLSEVLPELEQFILEERTRQNKRPGKRNGALATKAIRGLFLPEYRPDIRAINTALCRARDSAKPGRPKRAVHARQPKPFQQHIGAELSKE